MLPFFKLRVVPAVAVIASLVIISSCSDDNNDQTEVTNVLDTYELVSARSLSTIDAILILAGYSALTDLTTSGYELYEITYFTTYRGEELLASALVSFPDTEGDFPMISFQNGTNSNYENAPTKDDSGLFQVLASAAGMGYICTIPDYIGFGSSEGIISPYHHADATSQSIIDLLIAAEELSVELGHSFNKDIFLAGYSEGGYATMATHKAIEELGGIQDYNLIASAPAAGGYDVKSFQEYYFTQTEYASPHFMAFVALSYQHMYSADQLLDDLFQSPYDNNIPDLFDGSLSGNEIDAQLNVVVEELIEPEILSDLDTDAKYSDFVDMLNENTITNWAPEAPMFMYHGDQDITVPYQNSVDTYDQMLLAGASSTLTFITIQGANHTTGLEPYVVDMLRRFDELK